MRDYLAPRVLAITLPSGAGALAGVRAAAKYAAQHMFFLRFLSAIGGVWHDICTYLYS